MLMTNRESTRRLRAGAGTPGAGQRSVAVRSAAAKVAVKAAKKQGKSPVPRLVKLAEAT